jgi:hypothetical protein
MPASNDHVQSLADCLELAKVRGRTGVDSRDAARITGSTRDHAQRLLAKLTRWGHLRMVGHRPSGGVRGRRFMIYVHKSASAEAEAA